MNPAWTSASIVLTLLFLLIEAIRNSKSSEAPNGRIFDEECYKNIGFEVHVEPEYRPYLDMCAYNRSKGIFKKFDNTEEFLDWVKENKPDDYEHNFWLKHIREEWPNFNPDTKHRQYTNKLAYHNKQLQNTRSV